MSLRQAPEVQPAQRVIAPKFPDLREVPVPILGDRAHEFPRSARAEKSLLSLLGFLRSTSAQVGSMGSSEWPMSCFWTVICMRW